MRSKTVETEVSRRDRTEVGVKREGWYATCPFCPGNGIHIKRNPITAKLIAGSSCGHFLKVVERNEKVFVIWEA